MLKNSGVVLRVVALILSSLVTLQFDIHDPAIRYSTILSRVYLWRAGWDSNPRFAAPLLNLALPSAMARSLVLARLTGRSSTCILTSPLQSGRLKNIEEAHDD